jgi:hypothetical protein
MNPDAQDLDA